jgi:hypothetical protein
VWHANGVRGASVFRFKHLQYERVLIFSQMSCKRQQLFGFPQQVFFITLRMILRVNVSRELRPEI